MPHPGAPEAAITGALAQEPVGEADDDDVSEWTIEELEDAKPKLFYFVRNGNTDPRHLPDEYKFSRRFEMGLQSKTIDRLNENWSCTKSTLELDAEIKKVEERTRLEFWSAIDTKMKVITISKKDQKMLGAGPLLRLLKKYESVNRKLCDKEIARIEKAEKARAAEDDSK